MSFVLVGTGQSHVLLRSLGLESRDGQRTTTGPLGGLVLPSDMVAARASSLVGKKERWSKIGGCGESEAKVKEGGRFEGERVGRGLEVYKVGAHEWRSNEKLEQWRGDE